MTSQQIAKAILLAHETNRDAGYTLPWDATFIAACEQFGLEPRIGLLLYYANTWQNDLQEWATDALEGT